MTPDLPDVSKPPTAEPTALTFESFLERESNRLAVAALMELAAGRGGVRSLGLIAPRPWGKTHLLTALAGQESEDGASGHSGRPRLWLPVGFETVWPPPDRWPSQGLVIADDVHLLAARPDLQQRLSQAFDAASAGGSPGLVFSAPAFPDRLTDLSEPLKSRLSGGLLLPLGPPEPELLLALALRRARELGLDVIPADLTATLVRRAGNDPRRLFGLLETLSFLGRLGGLSPAEAFARLSQSETGPFIASGREMDLDDILAGTAAAFGLKVSDLTGHSRLRQAAWPRRVAMHLSRELTRLTTTEIGQAFGGRDHSTVIHALKKIRQELQSPSQSRLVENIKRSLLETQVFHSQAKPNGT